MKKSGRQARQYLDRMFAVLRVEDEWVVWGEDSFTWWPYRNSQTVRVESLGKSRGDDLFRLTVETDFLIDESDGKLDPFLEEVAALASLYGIVRDESSGLLRLTTSAVIYDSISGWLPGLFGAAAAYQLSLVYQDPEKYLLSDTRPAFSSHPQNGERTDRKKDVLAPLHLISPIKDAAWSESHEFEQIAALLTQNGIVSTASKEGLTAEVPFGPDGGPAIAGGTSALITAVTDKPHPDLGPGLLTVLRFPPLDSSKIPSPLELNRLELGATHTGNLLGSWFREAAVGDGPAFASFYPAGLSRPGLALNIMLWYVAKARWAEALFRG